MERELFTIVTRVVDALAGTRTRPPKCQFSDRDIILVLVWAVLHDRPIDWACRRKSWPFHDRTRPLPSGSTMCRRLRTDSVLDLMLRVLQELNRVSVKDGVLILDAKALPLAWHTADPDAGVGRGAGALAKGYKLHMIVDGAGNLEAFAVLPLNVGEQAGARLLIHQLAVLGNRWMLGDSNYDCNHLYDAAGDIGVQLLAPQRCRNAKGLGHCYHSPHRLRALRLMKNLPLHRGVRRTIEGCFGTLGNVIGGLNGLPNWVRRLHRVERWVTVKLIIDAAHRRLRRSDVA